MSRTHTIASLSALVLLCLGCPAPTKFEGQSRVEGGPYACQQRCAAFGMELIGMVSMGEQYTDGCICGVVGRSVPANAAATAAGGAAAGVMMQTQAAAAAAQQQQMNAPR